QPNSILKAMPAAAVEHKRPSFWHLESKSGRDELVDVAYVVKVGVLDGVQVKARGARGGIRRQHRVRVQFLYLELHRVIPRKVSRGNSRASRIARSCLRSWGSLFHVEAVSGLEHAARHVLAGFQCFGD